MTPITRRINLAEKEYVYHLCRDTTHQEMYNADLFNTRDDAWITVKVMDENRIVKQFPIPPLGHHYCRFCNGEFVIAPPSVSCTNHTADIHYGYLTFRVHSYKTEYLPDSDTEPLVSNGLWQLEKDGTMTYDGLAFSSATGYPAVFAQDGIYIDSMGTMVYRKPERFPPQPNLRYISGTQAGFFAITSDRDIHYNEKTYSVGVPVVAICNPKYSYLFLTASGTVHQLIDDPDWDPFDNDCDQKERYLINEIRIGEQVHSLTCGHDIIAAASDHTVYLYRIHEDNQQIDPIKTIARDETICEIAVSRKLLVLKYLSGDWEVLDWKTEKTVTRRDNDNLEWLQERFATKTGYPSPR